MMSLVHCRSPHNVFNFTAVYKVVAQSTRVCFIGHAHTSVYRWAVLSTNITQKVFFRQHWVKSGRTPPTRRDESAVLTSFGASDLYFHMCGGHIGYCWEIEWETSVYSYICLSNYGGNLITSRLRISHLQFQLSSGRAQWSGGSYSFSRQGCWFVSPNMY